MLRLAGVSLKLGKLGVLFIFPYLFRNFKRFTYFIEIASLPLPRTLKDEYHVSSEEVHVPSADSPAASGAAGKGD